MLKCTSGNGGHLWFTSYSDVGECSYYFCCVAGPRKYGYSLWNFVAIWYRSWGIALFHMYIRWWQPSLIYCSRRFFIPASGIWPPSWFPVRIQASTVHHRSPIRTTSSVQCQPLKKIPTRSEVRGGLRKPPFGTNITKRSGSRGLSYYINLLINNKHGSWIDLHYVVAFIASWVGQLVKSFAFC